MLWSLALLPMIAGAVLAALPWRSRLWVGAFACTALALVLLLSLAAPLFGWSGSLDWGAGLRLTAALTPVAAAAAILVPLIALPVFAYAAAHEDRIGLVRLMALLLVFVGGMELLVIAADLLTLLIGWELVGACSWALISHHWRDRSSPASGLYAFLMTRFGDLGMFAAAMAAFAATGSLAYAELANIEGPYLQIVAFGLLISAAAKSGQVPFSPWLFRAMAGPTSVSALLHAATMVAAGAYLLIRLEPQLARAEGFSEAVLVIGLVTALGGGLAALMQNHAKKLLAASTSAHFGLMFVAVGAGYPGVALLHLVVHAAFKALLFLVSGVAGDRAGSFLLHHMGLGRALPALAAISAVGALALAGIPPLGGGWTKEEIVSAAGHASGWAAFGVMLAGALSAAYAMRFHILAYGRAENPPPGEAPRRVEYAGASTLALLTLALSVLWLPPVHDLAARFLAAELPTGSAVEIAVSLTLLGLGLAAGRLLAKEHPTLGREGAAASAAEWFGLPALFDAGVARPVLRLSLAAGRIDDAVIDAAPKTVAAVAGHASRAFARGDDAIVDAAPRTVARGGGFLARVFARRDRRVVDRGVELSAAFTLWLARIGDRIGEAAVDGVPEGSARLVAMGGRDARQLQTGLSHQYYALMAAGAVIMIAILLVGI